MGDHEPVVILTNRNTDGSVSGRYADDDALARTVVDVDVGTGRHRSCKKCDNRQSQGKVFHFSSPAAGAIGKVIARARIATAIIATGAIG
jgi:hypothetical protein